MSQVISLLVENRAGVLARVVGLFAQRGYNISSLNVAPTNDPTMSRITLATDTDERGTEQVIKQLNKLIDVINVTPYRSDEQIIRELALVRVQVREEKRSEILSLAEIFRARVIDASPKSLIFEVTGPKQKIDAFIDNMAIYGVTDVHRTGQLALSRGPQAEPEETIENETAVSSKEVNHEPSKSAAASLGG